MLSVFLVTFYILIQSVACRNIIHELHQPQQFHLGLAENPKSMYITWATEADSGKGFLKYGENETSFVTVEVSCEKYIHYDGYNNSQRAGYVYKAVATNLKLDTTYVYSVGNSYASSKWRSFKTLKSDASSWSPTILLFGDLGLVNPVSMSYMKKLKGTFSYVLHLGDIAYDMDDDEGIVGDKFMNMIEPLSAYHPYMTIPGNHDSGHNFTEYKNRFNNPGKDNLFYSLDIGPAHIIFYNSEAYYFLDEYGYDRMQTQYNWLEQDLIKAVANRKTIPWIIVHGHRGLYCSSMDTLTCTKDNLMRVGYKGDYSLEALFHKYGVDLAVNGHEHDYERMYPLYDYNYEKFSSIHLYENPKYTTYVILGNAGNEEDFSLFQEKKPVWSVVRERIYGYAMMDITSSSLNFTAYGINEETNTSLLIDYFTITKDT